MFATLSHRLRRLDRAFRARLSLVAPALGNVLKTQAPILQIEYQAGQRSRALIIFLPGIGDLAEDFERQGFIQELRRHGVAADAVAVDAHYGYYATRLLFERLAEDVFASARVAGYEEIWMVGISLGGFGTAAYAARHHAQLSGILLLAPYLGGKVLGEQIAQCGGVHRWEPGHVPDSDVERGVWRWFKRHLNGRDPRPHIYLGYGGHDSFARMNGLLAEALPPERVFVVEGGHDWRTWKKLWRQFLAAGPIGRRHGAQHRHVQG
jgi:pimeloyl-ACP methyl ester carboxylesterase